MKTPPSIRTLSLVFTISSLLSACAIPLNSLFTEDPLPIARSSPVVMNPDHVVPSTLEDASKLPPQNLGLYSPNGLSTSMTPNNTGIQSTQMTPSLATPFMALKEMDIPQTSQSAIPLRINTLISQKKWDEALAEIELAAKKNPKNVQLSFVKSRILIEKGQLEQARQVLLLLIENYPELPEPYNNLAVLYANAGKLELARENLEMCLKLAPNYATALQNLGDVYTKMAAQYYGKAFQNNRRLSEAQRKQKLADAITNN